MIAILFWSLLLAACAYAIILGGWEGRATTLVILLASLGTVAVNWMMVTRSVHGFWASTNSLMLLVDGATFLAMYVIALKSDRWWPLWVAAFQLNSVVAHAATVISPEFTAIIYQGYEGLWAIPGQLVMVFGIYRDRRRNIRYDLI